jgi:hypothetical protein
VLCCGCGVLIINRRKSRYSRHSFLALPQSTTSSSPPSLSIAFATTCCVCHHYHDAQRWAIDIDIVRLVLVVISVANDLLRQGRSLGLLSSSSNNNVLSSTATNNSNNNLSSITSTTSDTSDTSSIDRSSWRGRVYDECDMRDVRERVDPFWRVCQFVDEYRPARKEVKEKLDRTVLLQLLMQHLDFYGFSRSSAALSAETGVKCMCVTCQTCQTCQCGFEEARACVDYSFGSEISMSFVAMVACDGLGLVDGSGLQENESRLVYYLRNCVQNVDSIYDLVLGLLLHTTLIVVVMMLCPLLYSNRLTVSMTTTTTMMMMIQMNRQILKIWKRFFRHWIYWNLKVRCNISITIEIHVSCVLCCTSHCLVLA